MAFCATEPMWSETAHPLMFALVSAAYGTSIAALVCSIACSRNAVVIGLLETTWLVNFGRISYGFYLYHNLIPDLTRNHHAVAFFGGTVPLWAHALGVVASFAISLLLAVLSWRLIEEPILRLKTRYASADTAANVSATSQPTLAPDRTHRTRDKTAASDAA